MVRPGIQLMTSRSADRCSSNLAYRAAVNLIAVDYFSNFWEIDRLRDTKASTCVCELNSQFPRNGIPDVVISDNGPQFTSSEFAQFGREWGFEHKTSSPGHQQAFVQAESAVKTAKSIFRKAKKSKSDPYLAILAARKSTTEYTWTWVQGWWEDPPKPNCP